MDHYRTLRKNGVCESLFRVECEQKFEMNETMNLEKIEICLLGRVFRNASPAALVGKFGDLSKQSHRISVI